jgi:hypothetical protein
MEFSSYVGLLVIKMLYHARCYMASVECDEKIHIYSEAERKMK